MKIIVGLGNPGRRYVSSPHNVGFRVIDKIACRLLVKINVKKDRLLLGEGRLAGEKIILAKPLTFMNLAGRPIGSLARKKRLNLDSLLVICDDLDLNPGTIRLRRSGHSGGHKGLSSVITSLKTEDFPRLRVGVGRPARKEDTKIFLLTSLSSKKRAVIKKTEEAAAAAALCWLRDDIEKTMSRFNRKSA